LFFLNILLSGIAQGLMWVLLSIGIYINFKILKFPDMTAEGSLTLGAVITVVLINLGVNPAISLFIAALTGTIPGIITAILATQLKIQPILSGILTMIAMYSVNLRIMNDRATIAILGSSLKNSFSFVTKNRQFVSIFLGTSIVIITIVLINWFFSTKIGFAIRATGSNPKMAKSSAINTNHTHLATLALSNALIAATGGLIAQFDYGAAIITMGQGAIVIGLASLIIGEMFIFKNKNDLFCKLIAVSFGTIIYRCLVAFALIIPVLKATDLKLITAVFVATMLCYPTLKQKIKL